MQNKQWQQYQQLELIPSTIAQPQAIKFPLTQPINLLWRSLINRITHQFNYHQKVEHLEKSWILQLKEVDTFAIEDLWHFPPYATGGLLFTAEPNVWQTTDEQGQHRWHVYEPKTGKISHWETEEAVRIWLENRYSH